MIGNDRSLMAFRDNALQFIADVCDVGFDDLPELNRKLTGLRNEIDQLEVRACAIAGEQVQRMNEQADRVARDERETAIPPLMGGF